MSVGKECYVIAGTSKLALGAIVGAVLENTKKNVIVVTTVNTAVFCPIVGVVACP